MTTQLTSHELYSQPFHWHISYRGGQIARDERTKPLLFPLEEKAQDFINAFSQYTGGFALGCQCPGGQEEMAQHARFFAPA